MKEHVDKLIEILELLEMQGIETLDDDYLLETLVVEVLASLETSSLIPKSTSLEKSQDLPQKQLPTPSPTPSVAPTLIQSLDSTNATTSLPIVSRNRARRGNEISGELDEGIGDRK